MSNTIDWGQAAVNNDIDFGKGARNNTIDWGLSQTLSPSGETNITGGSSTPAFNTKSILFDGVDDRVDLTQVSFNGEFSVSFWTKPDRFNNYGAMGSASPLFFLIHLQTADQIRMYLQGGAVRTFIETAGNDMVLNQWQHIMICRNSSGVATAYRNGVQFGFQAIPLPGTFNLKYIGAYNAATEFSGGIDEAAYWNTDQGANASAIYNGGVPASLATYNPLGWWRCGDGDTAPILSDNGSGGNDGTMINFTTFSTDVPT